MTKLNLKPTPAQARLLWALRDNPALSLLCSTGRYTEWRGGNKWELERIHGKIRFSTANACIKAGWIDRIEPEENVKGRWLEHNSYILTLEGLAAADALDADDLVASHKGVSVHDIHRALKRRHTYPEWIYVEEVRLGTGFGRYYLEGFHAQVKAEQRIDGFALNCYYSKRYERVSYEIKISRGDFLNEVKHPDKRVGAQMVSNRFYFAAPEGLIKPEEVPDGCGLVEIRGDFVRTKVRVPWSEAADWHPSFISSIFRSVVKQR